MLDKGLPKDLSHELSLLTLSEQVEACCAIAREKLERGDYDEGCAALRQWWTVGKWPKHSGLNDRAAAIAPNHDR